MSLRFASLSRAFVKGHACALAAVPFFLAGCDLLGKSEGERPIVLHLSLHDSLSAYDSVHIALTPITDPSVELEHVWRGHLISPSSIPAYTLQKAKDPFLVKVLGFRKVTGFAPREQLALATYIFYEGGRKRIERPLLPAPVPFNRLSRLAPGAGSLEPAFDPDVLDYTLRLARGATSVTLEIAAEYGKALVSMNGEAVLPSSPIRTIPVAGKDTLVTITVIDLLQARTYQVQVSPEKALPLALDSVWHSTGTLTPAFHPDSTSYRVVLPSVISTVDFKLWPADPPNTSMTFQGSSIFPGTQRSVIVAAPGGSVTAAAVLTRSGATREYRFEVVRSP